MDILPIRKNRSKGMRYKVFSAVVNTVTASFTQKVFSAVNVRDGMNKICKVTMSYELE